MSDLIKREDLFELMMRHKPLDNGDGSKERYAYIEWLGIYHAIRELPSADRPQVNAELRADFLKRQYESALEEIKRLKADRPQGWIPCSERLPEDIRPVLVTWKNNDPASYYQYIVGKHFIGTAHYHRGKWYWYSSVTEDLLAEYDKCDSEEFDEAIEAVAWMPLPKPWKGADDGIDND